MLKISGYFKTVRGMGILATADVKGVVDMAVLAKPHIIDEEHFAFIITRKSDS